MELKNRSFQYGKVALPVRTQYHQLQFVLKVVTICTDICMSLVLRDYVLDFVEICNVCVKKAIIEAAKRIINSDKVCHSYSDFNFGVTFFGTQCISIPHSSII